MTIIILTITHYLLFLWCHIPVLQAYVQDFLHKLGDKLQYHIAVLPVSFQGSFDEPFDELQYDHGAVLPIFFQGSLDEPLNELQYHVVAHVVSCRVILTNLCSGYIAFLLYPASNRIFSLASFDLLSLMCTVC